MADPLHCYRATGIYTSSKRRRNLLSCNNTPYALRFIHKPATSLTLSTSSQAKCHSKENSPAPLAPISSTRKLSKREKRLFQPFRRGYTQIMRAIPSCVPLLDLSDLNQPDALMEPLELLVTPTVDTSISWGNHIIDNKMEELSVCDSHAAEYSSTSSSKGPLLMQSQQLQTNQLEYVGSKILSHERIKASTSHGTTTTFKSKIKNIYTESLEKTLQFEARFATQNGRDVHRLLCGYFFTADNSITVYEFRQLGKRQNAQLLICRGIRHICTGAKKGQPYSIYDIKKGESLQFESKCHPELPASLKSRSLVCVTVTVVDEVRKATLLNENRELGAWQEDQYVAGSISPNNVKKLETLQGMFRNRLTGRASMVLVSLGQHLAQVAVGGVISFIQLQQCLRHFHVSLTTEDMELFWQLLRGNSVWSDEPEGIYHDLCLQVVTGQFSEDAIGLVRQVFMKLDTYKSGYTSVIQMKKFFSSVNTESFIWQNMLAVFAKNDPESVPYADFENFHLGLRIDCSESKFVDTMKTCWNIN